MNTVPKDKDGYSQIYLLNTHFYTKHVNGLQVSRSFGHEARCPTGFFKPIPDVYKVTQDKVKAIVLTTDGAIDADALKTAYERQSYQGKNQQSDSESLENDGFIKTCIHWLAQLKGEDPSITNEHMDKLANEFSSRHCDDMKIVLIPGAYSATKKALPNKTAKKPMDIFTFGVASALIIAIGTYYFWYR